MSFAKNYNYVAHILSESQLVQTKEERNLSNWLVSIIKEKTTFV